MNQAETLRQVQLLRERLDVARVDACGSLRAFLQSASIENLAKDNPDLEWWLSIFAKKIAAIDGIYKTMEAIETRGEGGAL